MALQLAEGETFVEGRSPKKARELLEKAEKAGKPGQVSTTSTGYIVPSDILEDNEQKQTEDEASAQSAPADHSSNPDETADSAEKQEAEDDGADGGEDQFDPSKHKVEEVNAYLADADEEERERVLAAERDGKARTSILSDDTEGDK